jgi:hypothetical protein
MSTTIPTSLPTNELLQVMAASHAKLLLQGFKLNGTKEAAVSYAAERSTAGAKAVALAIAQVFPV